MRLGWIALVVLLALLHTWAVFQGIANLIAAPAAFAQFGAPVPWWLIILGLIVPVVTFVSALILGRGRILSHRVALLVVSLATANAFVLASGALGTLVLAFQAG